MPGSARWLVWVLGTAIASAGPVVVSQDALRELRLTVSPTTRLLVVAPHPDDEALGAAALMHRVRAAGGSVRLALMTSGDGFPEGVMAAERIRRPGPGDFRRYGDSRERETLAAAASLGIDRAHVWFLGFPDEGLCLLASKYRSPRAGAYESPYTGRATPSVPEQVIRGTRYRGQDVRRELEGILLGFLPDLIVLPHANDEHPDHCATFIFVDESVSAVSSRHHGYAPRVLQYLVHYDAWPRLREPASNPLVAPADLHTAAGTWWSLPLTPEEAAVRRRTLQQYATQHLVIGPFLQAFARPNELFFEGSAPTPPECWCDEAHVASERPPRRREPAGGRRR